MSIDIEDLKVQGVKINYYYICKRKLWLFSKGITMEQNSSRVESGKIVHENSYKRMKSKEVLVDDILKLASYVNLELQNGSSMSRIEREHNVGKGTFRKRLLSLQTNRI